MIGERVWDVSRILDAVFDKFDFIDEDDVVCTGNSGGDTATYYLSCLDERIKVSAPSCSVCEFEDSIGAMPHCLCNHVPSIRRYFEMGDMAGLIAPRRLIIAAGKEDSIFPINGVQRSYEMVKRMYKAAGTPEKCSLVVGDGGHLNYADLIWEEYYKKETQ